MPATIEKMRASALARSARERGETIYPRLAALPVRATSEHVPSILQVAIKTDDGIIHTLPRPARHGDIIGHLWRLYPAAAGRSASDFGTQGFLLTDGTFVDRADGWIIAVARDQLLSDARARDVPHLFTEDLW